MISHANAISLDAHDAKDSRQSEDIRQKAIDAAIARIEKEFGKGSIMTLADGPRVKVDVVGTGSLGLDLALGVGGLPRGRIVEIYGPEASGKTTITLQAIAEAQKKGLMCAFVDAEHALDVVYAENLGVDLKKLLISQPDHGEQALGIVELLVRSGVVDVIVVDSVAALTPKKEIDGDVGDSMMGVQARMMSQAMRKLASIVSQNNVLLIFTNQLRNKIGVVYGSPEVTTGGTALRYYASVRLDIRRIGSLKVKDDIIGNQTRVKVAKNKVAPPFRQAEFDIMFGRGVARDGEIVDLGVKMGIIEKSGAWYAYGDTRIGHGREQVKAFLNENPEIMSEIEGKIRAIMAPGPEG